MNKKKEVKMTTYSIKIKYAPHSKWETFTTVTDEFIAQTVAKKLAKTFSKPVRILSK